MTLDPQPAQQGPGPSGGRVAAVVGGSSLALYVVDRLLADQGALASSMLARLGPVAGPAWANWPVLVLVAGVAWWASGRWREASAARAAEARRAEASSAALATSVSDVATGLGALRTEVHSLSADLRQHADAVDARFVSADASLKDFVRSEVSPIRERVAVLEGRRRRRPDPAA
mgnify:FL=1